MYRVVPENQVTELLYSTCRLLVFESMKTNLNGRHDTNNQTYFMIFFCRMLFPFLPNICHLCQTLDYTLAIFTNCSLKLLNLQPQNCMPDVIIWMLSGSKRIAYTRFPAYHLLYSSRGEDACGKFCGKISSFFLKVSQYKVMSNV